MKTSELIKKTSELEKKFNELAKRVPAMLQEFKRAAIKSGALDIETADNDYSLPKVILSAALIDVAQQWEPKSSLKKDVKNLRAVTYASYLNL